jgi:nitrate reductase molybdenum cofactor assembly chaperone
MSAPRALLSLLLRYPDERVIAAVDDVPALPPGPVRGALERFVAGWTGDRAATYVETFDLRRRASLNRTYYAHGDTRERGMALLRLKKLYRAAGLPLASDELPDHLAIMLAFAALAPPRYGDALLAVLARPTGGWLSDRIGASRVLLWSFIAVGALAALLAPGYTSMAALTICCLTLAVALGLGMGAVFKLVPGWFPDRVGAVTGVVGAAGGLGGFFPPLVMRREVGHRRLRRRLPADGARRRRLPGRACALGLGVARAPSGGGIGVLRQVSDAQGT